MPHPTIFGLFKARDNAQVAVDRLKGEGFSPEAISALFPDNSDSREFARANSTTAPEGTASGPTADRKLEGSTGLARPLSGPKEGALTGALRVMGVTGDDADSYGNRVTGGEILISVRCDGEANAGRATTILRDSGAEDVDTGLSADPMTGRPQP